MYRFLFFVVVSSVMALGCGFDPPGVDGSADAGGSGDGGPADAGPCLEDVAAVTVNGRTLVADQTTPLFTVMPGDSIALSATGSCVTTGTIEYNWTILSGDKDLAGTADTSVQSENLSVYPEHEGTYEVTLTVSDGSGGEKTLTGVAFDVPRWTAVTNFPAPGDGALEFGDMSFGDGFLWVAAKEGAFQVPLDDPINGTIFEVNTLLTGAGNVPLPIKTKATFYDANTQFAWFSNEDTDTDIYRGNFQVTPPVGQDIDTGATTGKIRAIAPLSPTGIVIAGQRGVYSSSGSALFGPVDTTIDARAIINVGTDFWIGSDDDLGLHKRPGSDSFDIFAGNDKPRRIILVNNQLWIASDDRGVAQVNPADPNDKTVYNQAGDDLPSDRVRFLASEASGDIWAATDAGIARYKADRDLWVTFDQDGLEDYLDARAIAIDVSNGQRTIYVGSNAEGMAVIRVPAQ